MATLLLRLCGPMQSWGVDSRFDQRDTDLEPSKSGVLGLLCAAMGIDRGDWAALEPMTHWKMGVRVLKAGTLQRDYQTAQLKPYAESSLTTTSQRFYLADADFLVGLECPERSALERAQAALQEPHWTLCLGRKAFVPSRPVAVPDGLVEAGLREALGGWVWVPDREEQQQPTRMRLVLEVESGANDPGVGAESSFSERWDLPLAAFAERRFGPRRVVKFYADFPV